MTHVLVLDGNNEDVFFCGSCKKIFNSITLFLGHKNNNDCNNAPLVDAKEPTTMSSNVEIPIPGGTKMSCPDEQTSICVQDECDQEMSCIRCKKKFKKIKTLQGHLKVHDQKPFQCVICGRCFIQNSHLQRHIISHRVWPDGLSETTAKSTNVDLSSYSCIYCDLVLSNYSQFRGHLKNHLSIKKYKCIQNQCNNFYDTVESLMHHVSSAHKTLTYSCCNCNLTFNSLEETATHYQSYNNTCVPSFPHGEVFKCSQCDAVFKKSEKLSLHMLTENHKKICVYCSKVFSSDKRLRLHLQIHRKLKPYQCNICGQSFHMKKYLSSHMLKHGERQFTCVVCKCLFKRQDSLHRHMKSHQIRKMFTCPFRDALQCKKEFSRSDKLKSHLKLHTRRMTVSTTKKKATGRHDTGTIEICIVPLDNKNKE